LLVDEIIHCYPLPFVFTIRRLHPPRLEIALVAS